MGRITRRRWVNEPPNNKYFSDIDKTSDECIILTLAEFEAMRLKHYINLNQQNSAQSMGISQPTFSRVLDAAHKKIITNLENLFSSNNSISCNLITIRSDGISGIPGVTHRYLYHVKKTFILWVSVETEKKNIQMTKK